MLLWDRWGVNPTGFVSVTNSPEKACDGLFSLVQRDVSSVAAVHRFAATAIHTSICTQLRLMLNSPAVDVDSPAVELRFVVVAVHFRDGLTGFGAGAIDFWHGQIAVASVAIHFHTGAADFDTIGPDSRTVATRSRAVVTAIRVGRNAVMERCDRLYACRSRSRRRGIDFGPRALDSARCVVDFFHIAAPSTSVAVDSGLGWQPYPGTGTPITPWTALW